MFCLGFICGNRLIVYKTLYEFSTMMGGPLGQHNVKSGRNFEVQQIVGSIPLGCPIELFRVPARFPLNSGMYYLCANVHIKDHLLLIRKAFFFCSGQGNRRWSDPVPVTGVRYNGLL